MTRGAALSVLSPTPRSPPGATGWERSGEVPFHRGPNRDGASPRPLHAPREWPPRVTARRAPLLLKNKALALSSFVCKQPRRGSVRHVQFSSLLFAVPSLGFIQLSICCLAGLARGILVTGNALGSQAHSKAGSRWRPAQEGCARPQLGGRGRLARQPECEVQLQSYFQTLCAGLLSTAGRGVETGEGCVRGWGTEAAETCLRRQPTPVLVEGTGRCHTVVDSKVLLRTGRLNSSRAHRLSPWGAVLTQKPHSVTVRRFLSDLCQSMSPPCS